MTTHLAHPSKPNLVADLEGSHCAPDVTDGACALVAQRNTLVFE